MISVLIGFVLLLLSGTALAIITNRRIEECVPVIFTGTIVFLYLFYVWNLLVVGRFALYAGMVALVIIAICRQVREKSGGVFWRSFFSPAIIWFLILAVIFLIFSAGMQPSVWDELRLWAAMPKALHFSQSLQVGEGSLLYSTMQSYPPGMALLVYFFTSFTGPFSYESIFAVYFIFIIMLVLPAMKDLSWKQWYVFPPVFFLVIFMPVILTVSGSEASGDWNFFFVCLYIDPILGCLMGHSFYQAVHQPYRHWFSTLSFTLSLFVLPSMKNIGALYACIAFFVAIVLALTKKEKAPGKKGRKIILAMVPLVGIAASYLSWQAIIRIKGTGEFIDMQLSSFTGEKFLNVLKGMTTWGKIPFIYYALFFIAMGIVATLVVKDLPKKTALIGAFGFLLAFAIFFYGYTSHYGAMLSSIHRYTSTFTFAFFVYLLMRYLSGIHLSGNVSFVRNVRKAYLLLLAGILLMISACFLLFRSKENQLENPSWADAKKIVAEADGIVRVQNEERVPAKCYLALGGDIRKQSQRHETYALCAIGSSVNICNIWCDKLFNEAEDGVVTDPDEMTAIWAQNLLSKGYEYVIFAEPDGDIQQAVEKIAPDLGVIEDGMVIKVIPKESGYGVSFEAP